MTPDRILILTFSHKLMFTLYQISATAILEIISEHLNKNFNL